MRFNNKNVILPEPLVPVGPANDKIWYTSSDSNIVTPYQTSSLPIILSNTYSDGKGIIKFAINITSIGNQAFYGCSSLTSVTIPNSVTSIGNEVFYNCTGLTSVTIPDNIISIGYGTFSECRVLSSITIPDSVQSIGSGIFSGCRGLTSVTIGSGVTSLGNYAFQNCTSLTSITIPNNISNIGNYAFKGCTSLTSISYTGTKSQWAAITKGTSWHQNVRATVVHCSDGDTSL